MPIDPFHLPMPRLLEVRKVAQILGLGDEEVRERLRDGELKGKKLGNRWRVDETVLRAYIDALPDHDQRETRRPAPPTVPADHDAEGLQ